MTIIDDERHRWEHFYEEYLWLTILMLLYFAAYTAMILLLHVNYFYFGKLFLYVIFFSLFRYWYLTLSVERFSFIADCSLCWVNQPTIRNVKPKKRRHVSAIENFQLIWKKMRPRNLHNCFLKLHFINN